jgi:hypothetical protein
VFLKSLLSRRIQTEHSRQAWIRRLNFFALATWLFLSLWLAGISFLLYGMDFRGYYAAARVLLSGGNPYDYQQVVPVLLQVTGQMGNNPYYYPPWFSWLFLPFTMLHFQVARLIWMLVNLILWNVGLWRVAEIVRWPPRDWRRYLFFSLATFSFAWITWRYEQAGILVFVILLAGIVTIEKSQWGWTGFWLALALIKPNITFIVVAALSLWLLRRSHWRPVLLMLAWLISLLLASTWITPDWYQPIFKAGFGQGLTAVLDGPDNVVAWRINTTLMDWLRTFGIGAQLRLPIYGLAILVGAIVLFRTVWSSISPLEVLSVSLLVSYGLTPYAMQYDNPSLIIVLFWALAICSASPQGLRVGLLLAGFIFSVIFWQQNVSWGFWMVAGTSVLVGWAWVVKTRTAPVKEQLSTSDC